MKKPILIGSACLLAGIASATVVDLEALQVASAQHAYTFEGLESSGWFYDDRANATGIDLQQDGFEDSSRTADPASPGHDASTQFSAFSSWASGSKGDALKSASTITYANSGTIEYLVQFGAMDSSHFVINGDGTGPNDRLRPITVADGKAYMSMGVNTGHDLIGGSTSVAYSQDKWYYVAQNWSISGGTVTMDAWVANLTDDGALTQTIDGASNGFDGNTTTTLWLGQVGNNSGFFTGGLDALAIYDAQLSESTITSHFNAIPEPGTLGLVGAAFLGMLAFRRLAI